DQFHFKGYFLFTIPCSIASTLATFGAYHKTRSKRMDTGTAAITTKDCNAPIPPPPILMRMVAIVAMMTAQNKRTTLGGFPSPVTAMEIEYDIESTVVTTNNVVKIKKMEGIMAPNGICSAIAMIALGNPPTSKGPLTEPGLFNS